MRYDTVDDLDGRTRAELETVLRDGEEFVTGVRTRGGVLKRFHERVLLTTESVVVVEPAPIVSSVRTIPLSGVSSVETERKGPVVGVRLRGPGDLDEGFMAFGDDGQHLADALRDSANLRDAKATDASP